MNFILRFMIKPREFNEPPLEDYTSPFKAESDDYLKTLDELYINSSLYMQSFLIILFCKKLSYKETSKRLLKERNFLAHDENLPEEKSGYYSGRTEELQLMDSLMSVLNRAILLRNEIEERLQREYT